MPENPNTEKPRHIERYGLRISTDGIADEAGNVNELALELAFYRDPETYPTGKPREYHFTNAFKIVWPNFEWNEWFKLSVWAWCNFQLIAVIGHTRASKTYGFAHIALLDYLAHDAATATSFTTTKFDALRQRIWGDMLRAIDTSNFPEYIKSRYRIQTASNELKLSIADRSTSLGDDKFTIQGIATDSADESAGKLRGQHADRRRIIVDEAQDVASAIYTAFLNAMSAPDFKGVLLSNPVDKQTPFGEWCEPENGWDSIKDTDLYWKTKKGGICLHFDGLQSPNIKAGKTIHKYLLDQDYVETIRLTKGENSLEWWMYVRGFFPPDGTVSRVWPTQPVDRASEHVEFDFTPEPWASLDAAFEHDQCALDIAHHGKLRDGRHHCKAIKSYAINTVSGGPVPKDYQIAREVKRLCVENGVAPENFIMDTTGNARGVYAILQVEWSPKVQSLNYGGEATDRPLRPDDTLGANKQVRYFVAELWFRASYLARDGMLSGIQNTDKKTKDDLEARRYTIKQYGTEKLMVVETKEELKARLNRSPDFGDTFCQFGELMCRKGYIGGKAGNGAVKQQWGDARKRAIKAASRYENEFSGDAK